MKKKVLALMLSAVMAFSLAACGDGNTETSGSANPNGGGTSSEPSESTPESTPAPESSEDQPVVSGEPTVIRYGTHWVNALDPYHVDDVSGEYTMGEAERQAALAGLEAIKNELNVEFEFIQYAEDTRTELMTSVLAGDPVCDIAVLWATSEATVLAQNVLQKLDDYVGLFEDDEASWLLDEALFGHYYLLDNDMDYVPYFPLVVNLTLLEKVDALKDADGNTIYPMDLYLEGNWTWSTFEDYLTKVDAYYSNVAAPADAGFYDTVQAYETDFRYAALAAMYANGSGIYRDGAIAADSDESIEAVQFIDKLRTAGLLTDCGLYDDGFVPRWCEGGNDFGRGATVFSDVPNWSIGGYASSCGDRGESIAIIPWPRADRLAADSEEYKQVLNMGDSVGILKGSKVDTELALKAYILYWQTYYKTLGGVDSVTQYKDSASANVLAGYGVDLYNEDYGDDALACFQAVANNLAGNPAGLLGIWENNDASFATILGKSLTGVDGTSSYDVTIKAKKDAMNNLMSDIANNLASDAIHDNQKPSIKKETVVLPVGTKYEDVDWTQYFTAEDSVDGVLDPSTATFEDMTGGSFQDNLNTAGIYEGDSSVKIHISDSSGNEETSRFKVVVYNPDNTEAPVITPKAELDTVAIDTDASTIDWKNFVESAVDADGLDVKDSITADLSELDTTTAGTYNVEVTVTDYAGNTSSATLEVTVAAAE
ncbi:MAG: hypothetical protein K2J60_09560 [Acetatifactor sp.]|nr:hypothetical protein [Acetatifactor sp.]